MSDPATDTTSVIDPCAAKPDEAVRLELPYHVVLLDDNQHTYAYVIEMLRRLFGCSAERGYQLAREVDTAGRAIVDTTSRERAELKRDQIRSYGADWRLEESRGSMAATIEPAV
jgi:ATP-dependent Clp protease adaptor protein ClpS